MALYGLTLSLADTSVHKLSDLIAAATGYATATNRFAQVSVQADPGNAGNVYLGDPNVASTNMGANLTAGLTYSSGPHESNLVSTLDIHVRASAATQKINVALRTV